MPSSRRLHFNLNPALSLGRAGEQLLTTPRKSSRSNDGSVGEGCRRFR